MTQKLEQSTVSLQVENISIPLASNWSKITATALNQLAQKREMEPFEAPPEPESEDISKHSILDKPLSFQLAPPPRLFAHIHADPIASLSKWEGGNSYTALEYAKNYFNHYIKTVSLAPAIKQKMETIIQLIEESLKISHDPVAIMKKVVQLKEGESFLMIGGFEGNPGHALLYKFTRLQNGNYDVYLYNSGAGLFFHPNKGVHHKERHHPVEILQNVPPEALCLSSEISKCKPVLFQRLAEYVDWKDRNSPLGIEDIYRFVFGHLYEKRRVGLQVTSEFISGQLSGGCTWKVIMNAFVRFELGDLVAYKNLEDSLKFDTTPAFYLSVSTLLGEESEKADELRMILLNSVSGQLLRLVKRRGNPEEVTRYCTLVDLRTRLKTIEATIRNQRLEKTQRVNWSPISGAQNYSAVLKNARDSLEPFSENDLKIASICPALPVGKFSAKSFKSSLASIVAQLSKNLLPASKQSLIEAAAESLPDMEEPFWKEIPERELKECESLLFQLLSEYRNLTIDPDAIHADEQNTALTLYAGQYQLCLRLDALKKGRLHNYGIYIQPFLDQIANQRYFLFFEPKAFKKQLKLIQFFANKAGNNPLLFNFGRYEILVSSNIQNIPDENVIDFAVRSTPELTKKFEERNKTNLEKFKKLPFEIVKVGTLLSSTDLFEGSDYDYIHHLRCSALSLQMFAGFLPIQSHRSPVLSVVLEEKEGNQLSVIQHYKSSQLRMLNFQQWRLHREAAKSDLDTVVQSPYLARKDRQSEAQTLIHFKKWGNIDWDRLLACVNCEPPLQPAKVIHYFGEHFAELTQTKSQTLFDLLFFKPFYWEKEWMVPLFNEIGSSSFLKQVGRFIKQGLNLFYEKQPGGKPDVFTCLFFIRLICRINAMQPDANLIDPLPLLNRWLSDPSLSPVQQSALHLHRAFSYLTRRDKKYGKEELLEILESWLLFCHQPLDPSCREPDLEKKVQRFIHNLASQFQPLLKDRKTATSFFNRLITKCGIADLSQNHSNEWEEDHFPQFTLHFSGKTFLTIPIPNLLAKKSFWTINILSGKIASEIGVLKLGTTSDYTEDGLYKRLFGNSRFPVLTSGDYLHFVHPRWGAIRLKPRGYETPLIYRAYPEGKWAQLISPFVTQQWMSNLPLSLIADQTHWMLLDDTKVILVDPLRGESQKCARIEEKRLTCNDTTISALKLDSFRHFEETNAIHIEENAEGTHLYFFRYRSLHGKTLRFSYDQKGILHFDENPAFVLPENQRLGLLSALPNYLYLHNPKTKREKILVPIQPVKPSSDRSITHFQSLDTEDLHRKEEYKYDWGKSGAPQKGVYQYIEFDLAQNGASDLIIPSSQEGIFYLAYLYLIQREYAKALKQLREISEFDLLSPVSSKILDWIFKAGQQYADETAFNAAIKLHAYLLLGKINRRPEMVGKQHLKVSPSDWVKRYSEGLNTIPSALRLSADEEKVLGINRSLAGVSVGVNYHHRLKIAPFYAPEDYKAFWLCKKPSSQDEERYAEKLQHYQKALETCDRMDFGNTFVDSNQIRSNFGYFYRLAKNSKTILEALAIAVEYELSLKLISSRRDYYTDADQLAECLIHFAIHHPDQAPLLAHLTDREDKFKWLSAAHQAFKDNLNTKSRFDSAPNPLNESAPTMQVVSAPEVPLPLFAQIEKLQKRPVLKFSAPKLLEGSLTYQFSFFSYLFEFFNFTYLYTEDLIIPEKYLKIKEKDLPEAERPYLKAIQQEIHEFFSVELPAGIKQNKLRKEFSLKQKSDLDTLQTRLLKGDGKFLGIEKTKEQLVHLRKLILQLANLPPLDSSERFLQRILENADAFIPTELEELIDLWMYSNTSRYRAVNPNLTIQESEQLDQLITLYLEYATILQQAQSAFDLVSKIKLAKQPAAELEDELAKVLEAGWYFDEEKKQTLPLFNPQKDRVLRIIEYRACLRIRQKQLNFIQNLRKSHLTDKRFLHAIGQMLMGEGKTTVATAALVMDAIIRAEERREDVEDTSDTLPFVIGPIAQFETLKRNLSISQRTYFNQKVVAIGLSRYEMGLDNLKWMREQLNLAQKNRSVVLLRPDTARALVLEALSLLHKIKLMTAIQNSSPQLAKVVEILEILGILGIDTSSILDELDVLLDPPIDMNFLDDLQFPETVDERYVDLTKYLVELMLDETLFTENKESIAKLLDLRNPNRIFNESLYFKKILPVLALHLAKYPEFYLKEDDHRAFARYVSGQMDPKNLTIDDRAFLSMLKNDYEKGEAAAKQAVILIATAKNICRNIVKSVLSRDVGKNFARHITKSETAFAEVGQLSMKVVIFEGTDTPTRNIPSNFFVSILMHFLTALCVSKEKNLNNTGIHPEQVHEFARQLRRSAEHFVDKNDEIFDETPEAKQCLEVTGIKLSEILKEENLKKATQTINADVKKVLLVEEETIKNEVTYWDRYFGSNSRDLVGILLRKNGKSGSVRGMTGTPRDLPSYSRELFENLVLDEGVAGQVAHIGLLRSAQNGYWLHVTEDTSVKGILDKALKGNPRASQVRAIADSAYFFSKSSNLTVAREIQEYFKDDENIQTILYFDRRKSEHPEELKGRPDFLMMLKKGSKKPIFIGSTAKSVLEKHQIDPKKTFIYLDDRHCEATDPSLMENAVVLKTINRKETERTRSQTRLRARKYFQKQDVETVVKKEERSSFMFGGKTEWDFLVTALKNQAIKKTDNAYLSLRKAIPGVARHFVIQKLIELRKDTKKLIEYFNTYEDLVQTTLVLQPWEQFGGLEESIDAKKAIEQLASKQIEIFKKINLNPNEQKEIETEVNQLVKEASASPYFPETILSSPMEVMDTDQQVEFYQEASQEAHQTIDIELERELDQELLGYLAVNDYSSASEVDWQDSFVQSGEFPLIQALDVKPFADHMRACKHYKKSYDQIFEGCLLASSNFARSTNAYLTVFHTSQKPAHQILVIQTKLGLQLLLLSIHEANFFKNYLSKKAPKNMWLIFSDQQENSAHIHNQLSDEEKRQFDRAMLQVHFLNGNVRALDKNEEAALQFINDKDFKLKMDFLKLRVEKDKIQRGILYRSNFLPTNQRQKMHLITHSYRKKHEQESAKKIATYTEKQVATINPNLAIFLSGPQIRYLTTREQLQKIKREMIKYVTAEQVSLLPPALLPELTEADQINAVNPKDYFLLTEKQLQMLGKEKLSSVLPQRVEQLSFAQVPGLPSHLLSYLSSTQVQAVTKDQVPYLEDHQIPLLVTKEQIQAIPLKKIALVSDKQVPFLTEEQMDLFPIDRVKSFDIQQLKYVRKAIHVAVIDIERVQFLPNEAMPLLKDHQIPGVSEQQVPFLVDAQVGLLTDEQIPGVTAARVNILRDDQLKLLKRREQIQAVETTRVAHISEKMVAYLSPTQVPYATKEQLPYLTDEQIPYITKDQAPHIPLEKAALVPPALVPFLTDAHLKFLKTREQVQAIETTRAALISDKMVDYLSPVQVPYAAKEQLPYLTDEQIPHIAKEQAPDIPFEKAALVPPELVCSLTNPHLKFLKTREQVQAIGTARVPLISEKMVAYLSQAQVPYATKEQLAYLTDEQIRHVTKDQAPHLPLEKTALIPPELVPFLTDTQLKFLKTSAQVQAIDPKRVSLIDQKMIASLSPAQVPYASKEQLPHLTNEQIAHIAKDQAPHLALEKAAYAHPDVVPALTDAHLKFLKTAAQIHAVALLKVHLIGKGMAIHLSQEQVPHAAKEQLTELTDQQILFITKKQAPHIPFQKAAHIPPELVSALTEKHLAFLVTAAQIQALSKEQLRFLKNEQIPYVKNELVPALSIKQVPFLQGKQLQSITSMQLKHIDNSQVKNLKKQWLPKLTNSQLQHVSPAQVPDLDNTQLKLLRNPEQIRAVPKTKTIYLQSSQQKLLNEKK